MVSSCHHKTLDSMRLSSKQRNEVTAVEENAVVTLNFQTFASI